MMNQTNLYFYFTPTKLESKEVTLPAQCSSIPPSTTTLENQNLQQKINKLEEEPSTCNEESQMTQRLLSFKKSHSSIPIDSKYNKTLFEDQDDGVNESFFNEMPSEMTLEKPYNKLNHLKGNKEEDEEEDIQNIKTLKLIKGISKNKQLKKGSSQCSIKINKFDSVKSLLVDDKKSTTLSENVSKLISQIQSNKDETKKALSPARNNKLNAILNRGSLKDRYRSLLGSKAVELKNAQNQELLTLMSKIDEIMMRKNCAYLSELISQINGLTILKMQSIMNVQPNLYQLSLKLNKYKQQDMFVELSFLENIGSYQSWKESRLADFKQRLYYSEKQAQNASSEQPAYISQKLTETIKEGLQQKQNQLKDEFTLLLAQQNQEQMISSVPLSAIATCVREYFESRNVSNIFKMNIIDYISKNTNTNFIIAETKLNDLINSYPNWLTEVKSSTLGSIIRINYQFDFKLISN
ncbi:hypothetical protein TTHERM_00242020 (macronuclear) [Tetrahymena thermophila SB210]|uniref:Uncharacterized protein n=1 Tax=Tetrahymena thermophila (strain SB210) TaxID=312017 RepID=I7LXI0_TETTS|nr:hypothetical protein TTHERM_00242020 [Tetrahymena thermophila SB210]EAS04681.1 hypothetical protein TTHERM_00242020 [Tetrahymena thermophila SB210]|eukprot:XP_001024926.1 hypothetical protein TTHERM_00242020 [Tetrahymena thermophila SB210]